MRLDTAAEAQVEFWDAPDAPTFSLTFSAHKGETIAVDKVVGVATSRDAADPVEMALTSALDAAAWWSSGSPDTGWGHEWENADLSR
jgi:kojibiose phosphorylase